jgi:L-amino acid N-acyltransferase YncA
VRAALVDSRRERADDVVGPTVDAAGCSHAARLLNGREVVIRPATTADLAGIIDFFERLSPTSRYSRFFSPQPRLRREMIARVVASGPERMSMLAQPREFAATSRNIVAVGGWIGTRPDARVEVSVAVADAWQGNLLGTYLMLALLRTAVAAGHERFTAEVLGTNARMLGLLGEIGAPTRSRCAAGVVTVDFDLDGAAADANGAPLRAAAR